MAVFEQLGHYSDQLTDRLLWMHNAPAAADLVKDRKGFVRKAQLSAVMATSQPMMAANICNALALVALENFVGKLDAMTLVWAMVVTAFALAGIASARKFKMSPERPVASVRAPGKITFSSFIIALLWCFPLLFLIPGGNLLEVAFISALTAGMIGGGALALYPVPLAGFVYVSVLSCIAFVTIVVTGALPILPFSLVIWSFALIITFSTKRHTVMFLSALIGRLKAERQRDMVNLLLDTYQGKGGQYLWRSDRHLNLTEVPASLLQVIGLERAEITCENLIELLRTAKAVGHDAKSVASYSAMKTLTHPADTDFEMILRIKNGRFLKVAGRGEVGGDADQLSYHGYLKDVSREFQAIEKVYDLATRDTMTGLLNYREFTKQAEAQIGALRDQNAEVLFVFLDADNLKKINDSFGHAVGDRLIKTIGARLEEQLPESSLVARKGGDEFVALVSSADQMVTEDWAFGLVKKISGSIKCSGLEIPVSCCVGVSKASSSVANIQALELEADRALYNAKSKGKGRATVYDEKFGQAGQRDHVLTQDLSAAIDSGQLALLFEPIVDLKTGAVLGAEALLRWSHPMYLEVAHEKIVSIAQTKGSAAKLFNYSLLNAITEAKKWQSRYFVSVNMQPSDLRIANFASGVADVVSYLQFPAHRLWLEVTESEVLLENGAVRENLEKLRSLGISIAIDFGAGSSSLNSLGSYPYDFVKIHQSLVKRCDQSKNSQIKIRTVKSLAELMGAKVVAQDVEQPPEENTLRRVGVEMAQGLAFCKPLQPNDVCRMLTEPRKRVLSSIGAVP